MGTYTYRSIQTLAAWWATNTSASGVLASVVPGGTPWHRADRATLATICEVLSAIGTVPDQFREIDLDLDLLVDKLRKVWPTDECLNDALVAAYATVDENTQRQADELCEFIGDLMDIHERKRFGMTPVKRYINGVLVVG